MYQNLAILCAIQLPSEDIVRIFGKDFKSSEASIAASNTLFANFGRQNHKSEGVAVSPKEVVDYVKEQILAGKTWEGKLRRFIALQYRGTILNGALLRAHGHGRRQDATSLKNGRKTLLRWRTMSLKLQRKEHTTKKARAFVQAFASE
jgi:hypothetical protein